ncbi:MAG: PPK2 family polyphosphate kinase [Dehalococcoidia bacterium]|nr:PPK2 family polyphosphate kinase [Dehalococcoidia bacterium]
MSKKEAKNALKGLRERLNELQDMLYADRRYGVLVVLQGIDTSGKDSTTKSVFEQVGPLGSHVYSFGPPGGEELQHDFLWRYHRRAPEKGQIAIFNRSHYEAVLVERVKGIVPPETWGSRYDQLNRFEEMLVAENIIVLKFLLHISKKEQRKRLQERIDNSRKHWKFDPADLRERERWDDYMLAFEDALTHCNTPHAPWHIVPADRKWYRDTVVARAIVRRLEELDLRYPPGPAGIEGLRVESSYPARLARSSSWSRRSSRNCRASSW